MASTIVSSSPSAYQESVSTATRVSLAQVPARDGLQSDRDDRTQHGPKLTPLHRVIDRPAKAKYAAMRQRSWQILVEAIRTSGVQKLEEHVSDPARRWPSRRSSSFSPLVPRETLPSPPPF